LKIEIDIVNNIYLSLGSGININFPLEYIALYIIACVAGGF
jgi:hypothetical protein